MAVLAWMESEFFISFVPFLLMLTTLCKHYLLCVAPLWYV